MSKAMQITVLLALAGAVLAVQGCREEEQNRPLLYDKGSYQGQPDSPLSDEQVDALRRRSAGQRF